MVDPSRIRNGSVKPLVNTQSTLVKLGQTWSDFGKHALDLVLRLFVVADLRQVRLAWFELSRFAY